MFAATGVTDGTMLKGVRRFGNGADTHSIVMRSQDRHGALGLGASQFHDQDWPAELGLIIMSGCGLGS